MIINFHTMIYCQIAAVLINNMFDLVTLFLTGITWKRFESLTHTLTHKTSTLKLHLSGLHIYRELCGSTIYNISPWSVWLSELPWHCDWSGETRVGRQMWGRRQTVWRAGGYLNLLLRLHHHRRRHCHSSLLLPRSHWPCHPQEPCAAGRGSCRGCCVESYWPYWRQKKNKNKDLAQGKLNSYH